MRIENIIAVASRTWIGRIYFCAGDAAPHPQNYWVTHPVCDLHSWVDFDLGCSSIIQVSCQLCLVSICPSRIWQMMEQPKQTQPNQVSNRCVTPDMFGLRLHDFPKQGNAFNISTVSPHRHRALLQVQQVSRQGRRRPPLDGQRVHRHGQPGQQVRQDLAHREEGQGKRRHSHKTSRRRHFRNWDSFQLPYQNTGAT